MTDQLRQILSANLKSARESGDAKRIAEAAQAMDDALAECQAHTADRVKRIETRVEKMDTTLDAINSQLTNVATSRAVLTEKYDATTAALNEVKLELVELKGMVFCPKEEPKKPYWVMQLVSNSSFQFFVLLLFLVSAFVYLCTGTGGVEAAKSTVSTFLPGGAK